MPRSLSPVSYSTTAPGPPPSSVSRLSRQLAVPNRSGGSFAPYLSGESTHHGRRTESSQDDASPDDRTSAAIRMALRYAARAARSNDPAADPDLEMMRACLRGMTADAQLDGDWWESAGLSSLLADAEAGAERGSLRGG